MKRSSTLINTFNRMRDVVLCALCVLLFTTFFSSLHGQNKINQLAIEAELAFNDGNYKLALHYYQQVDSIEPSNGYYKYMLGLSYLFSKTNYTKALASLEYASRTITDKELIPDILFYLASTYHQNNRFEEAIETYNKVLQQEMLDGSLKIDVARQIEMANNARELIANPIKVTIKNIGNAINSEYPDYAPVISADERILIFTSKREGSTGGLVNNDGHYFEDIYVSYQDEFGKWKLPINMGSPINTKYHDASISLSVDGERLLIYRSDKQKKAGEIYKTQKEGKSWTSPEKLGKNINTGFLESAASISADGTTIYFSSNRDGSIGGKDIYIAKMQSNGQWGEATNLSPFVNTPYDEESPFIHPDGKTLYFSSKGHNSMGGFDIFKSEFINGIWTKPVNIGYPINTPSDDVHFVLSAKGKRGYFTSVRQGGFGEEDIYVIEFPEANIPLTMIRGTVIIKGDKKTKVNIKVLDKESNDLLKYVYNPNPETGKYLLILPPGKNYDMIVEAENYLPYVFNIHIPNQTYFYELYQTMYMKTVSVMNEPIGQGISIENSFYDAKDTLSKKDDAQEKARDATLLTLIDKIIETTDAVTLANLEDTLVVDAVGQEQEKVYDPILDLVENIIEYTDSNALANLDRIAEQGFFSKADKNVIFYDKNNVNLEPMKIGNDTIYVIPQAVFEAKKNQEDKSEKIDEDINTTEQVQTKDRYEEITIKTLLTHLINFEFNNKELQPRYKEALDNIILTLKEYPQLKVKISGHTDNTGESEYNKVLSKQRAETVAEYFIKNGVAKTRITTLAMGEMQPIVSNDTEEGKNKNRRVDIQLIETTIQ